MVDYVAEKNKVNDIFFEKTFYQKYVADIKTSSKYQELEKIVANNNLQILFSYCKDDNKRFIQYEVGFEICDSDGKMLSVPTNSRFWDQLYNLLSFFPVIAYKKRTQKLFTFEIDQAELEEDCTLFIEYLEDILADG